MTLRVPVTVSPTFSSIADWVRKAANAINLLINDASTAAGTATWGSVSGTLSNQTDLQTALDAKQPLDSDLTALAGVSTAGLLARTGSGTAAARTLQAPAAGLSITNPAGTAGDPTFALANDLAALEALSGTNTIYHRSASDTWSAVTIGDWVDFTSGTLSSKAFRPMVDGSNPPVFIIDGDHALIMDEFSG